MNYVSYIRVSTQQQGRSGLGLEAQQASVKDYVTSKGGTIVAEFVEVETGKGSNALDRRPQLRAALALCKKLRATLVLAKLDRLSRSVAFTSGLLDTGVGLVVAEMPQADKTMLHFHAVMSEWERDQISARTKAALAAAKARGVALGVAGPSNLKPNLDARKKAADTFAEELRSTLKGLKGDGLTQRQQVAKLNATGVKTPAGKSGAWTLVQLQRVYARLAPL